MKGFHFICCCFVLFFAQAEAEGFSHFHLYVCAAFLIEWRKEILSMVDFQVWMSLCPVFSEIPFVLSNTSDTQRPVIVTFSEQDIKSAVPDSSSLQFEHLSNDRVMPLSVFFLYDQLFIWDCLRGGGQRRSWPYRNRAGFYLKKIIITS